ncbi:fatty acid synthase-like isoform X3 [Leguminivora glycinivorella]|uniref:fatty acid synthase-like isoform X1 n=1 Tax=Leguminivora glycinivorella TaxID=1035111 RepID=UPI00200D2B87|nr:fatty acid synthase-like isoform X1 [Leguminivora glycinivorella]XP_047994171.1 fatty acid synthase-like isoform X2 [Leguminivora glycinivorella]XP_047994172.1 fatty acid synthase-like isoform X3 [Leguminivora glycinivorella]
MAPTPHEIPQVNIEENRVPSEDANQDDKRVVISGMSGSYPRSLHVKDLADVLYNKVDPIADSKPRWDYNHPEVPNHVGILPALDLFDGQFFRVAYRMGINMDPMSRKLLEQVYQAIYDAGVNPEQLSGKKIGVYVGTCLSETEKVVFYSGFEGKTGLGIAGCNKSMFANRVSYWLNAKGPSLAIDGGCCSSAVALEQAYQALTRGDCEAAVVGGCNICLHPQTSIHFGRSISLSQDGKNKSYDKSADGCVRSEGINVLFLQKAKDALRIYADVVYSKVKYIAKTHPGSWKRTTEEVTEFLKEFYDEIKVSPSEVEYVEGFGAGDADVDKTELEAIDNVFCKGRSDPLYVGSVMSNVGYLESASGIAGITKVLLGYHTGQLAGNLHCEQPRDDVAALREGRLQILRDHKPTARSYIAVNGLSVTGINSHVLLHGHYKPKDLSKYQCNIPRLVLISSRTDSAVTKVIEALKSKPIDPEELALIQNIHSSRLNGHLGRGFTILDTDNESKTVSLCEKATYFDSGDRPLWFVYSGMGSQWVGMGAQLMRIPIFAAAIEKCQRALQPKGIDILHIITSTDKTIFDNILHSFVGIAAVQIGLTDILLELGLVPDKIIGHSVGELGCAYADGCLTAEEMILSAYSRGLVSVQTPFIKGSMAAVGIGFEEVSKMVPPEIEVACHNSPESSTISGPADVMTQFVADLTAKSFFAKEVPCSNIAYHSRYIAEAGPGLLKYLKEVITTPKLRSERWVSTSVPQDRWEEDLAKYSSAEYHTNNLLKPVLFEETSRLIPKNAVLVEVAPHGLLQAILKRSLSSCANVPLTRRGHVDSARFLLEAIGQLFMEGFYPDIRQLYPKVEFPVSTGTPHLSHLVEWAHQEKWLSPSYASPERLASSTCIFKISLHDAEHLYLHGHQIEGKTLFPFASALICAWDTLAMVARAPLRETSATFRDVILHAQPVLHNSRLLRLTVALQRGSGHFEIEDGISKVASGYIVLEETKKEEVAIEDSEDTADIVLGRDEIYNILNERGYLYQGEFRGIRGVNSSLTAARVPWYGRWETFLDSLLQLNALRQPHDHISQPAFIREITIKTDIHTKTVEIDTDLKVEVSTVHDYTRCGGVTLKGINFRNIVKSDQDALVFDTSKFDQKYQLKDAVNVENGERSRTGKVLRSSAVGDLESLHWVEAPASEGPGIPVKVHFAGLNASDILKVKEPAVDQHESSDGVYGMDFSGTLEDGTRVMGLMRGAAREQARALPHLLWPVPAHWSLEDAATVPFAYAHALYCLTIKTSEKIYRNMTVLVSDGSGATGQAIIALALHVQCRVFVVVSSVLKKNFLLKVFPKLNADDIICCRDDAFVNRVLSETNGMGCDIVICSRGQYKDAYIQCCGPLGLTLDIHQVKRNENFSFKMFSLTHERSYFRVDFSSLFEHNDVETFQTLQRLVAEGISAGWVQPLSRVTYAPQDAKRAFRTLARGAHLGRVLLRVHEATSRLDTGLVCSGTRSQLMIGDSSLVTRLAAHLVKRGARNIHVQLNETDRLARQVQEWKKIGVNIKTTSEDLAHKDCASNLVKQSLSLGPVEGVFVVISEQINDRTREIYKALLDNLDAETRKMSSIKYFVVIGINNSVGDKVCVSRAADGFPAMMLSVSIDTKIQGSIPASYSDIVNATERGLQTKQPIIFAQYPPASEESLTQQIENVIDITITGHDGNKTLLDLGVTKDSTQKLWVYLRDKQNINIPEDDIPLLSVEKIREMEETLKVSNTPVEGLTALIPFIDTDELNATINVVVMHTLTQGMDMRVDEFDASESCLYIVPGLQGLHQRYLNLCERLKLAAVVLQPGLDKPDESLEDMTKRYTTMILKKKGENKKFYLVGHELGVLSVFEIAAALEDQGMTGTVFCLGGGPDELMAELKRQMYVACSGDESESALQEAVARHMCGLMGYSSTQLHAALRDAPTWSEKVEESVRALRGRVPHSMQYARLLIQAVYARITKARNYIKPEPRALQSRVVVLRSPSPSHLDALDLQRHTREPLAVHDLHAPLSHAAEDLRSAAIINQYLDAETQQAFSKKTLCQTYLMSSESYFRKSE